MSDLFFHDGAVVDFAYEFLEEVAQLLDSKLDALAAEAAADGAADAAGVYDRMEHVAGFGFVACQEYIARIAGVDPKARVRELGPMRGAVSLVQVVDAAANYWKHRSEWGASPGKLARRTIDVLDAIGVSWSSNYPVIAVLRYLQGDFPRRFVSFLPGFAAWRDAVLASRQSPKGGTIQ